MKNSEVILWDREHPSTELLANLKSEQYFHFLVMPNDYSNLENRLMKYEKMQHKTAAFILLDGTWNQAKRMLKKSDYLNNLPVLALDIHQAGNYRLRKASDPHRLSTVETVIHLLIETGQKHSAQLLNSYFNVFRYSYLKYLRGEHSERPEIEFEKLSEFSNLVP